MHQPVDTFMAVRPYLDHVQAAGNAPEFWPNGSHHVLRDTYNTIGAANAHRMIDLYFTSFNGGKQDLFCVLNSDAPYHEITRSMERTRKCLYYSSRLAYLRRL